MALGILLHTWLKRWMYLRRVEKLGIHDNITTVVKLFDLPDKCAKAEEGHLFVKNEPADLLGI